MYEVKKISETFLHKLIFHEGESIVALKNSINKIPNNAKFSHIEPNNEFDHKIVFYFTEEKIIS